MLLPAYINVNRNGIPAIRSLGVTVTTTNVQFDFNNHRNIGAPFRGLIIVNLAHMIPAGTTTTLPVVFTSDGGNEQQLMKYNNTPATVADLPGNGIMLVWFESQSNYLQLIS